MDVTLQLADQVRRLGRDGLTTREIAGRLVLPEAAIVDVLRMLGLPLPGEHIAHGPHTLSDDERAALRAKMPKKWQDRKRR